DNQGAIPPNLLTLANTDSNSTYLRQCREHGIKPHPARFPHGLHEFFIKFITEPGDLVIDPFAGSNITGEVAERLQRRCLAFELVPHYLAGSKYRFPSLRGEASLFSKGSGMSTVETGVPEHVTAESTINMSQLVLLEEPASFDTEGS
ncbi:MAG: DNA methyltransferase, partial [Anaerolineae bacterium]